jgi:hypothetical protein
LSGVLGAYTPGLRDDVVLLDSRPVVCGRSVEDRVPLGAGRCLRLPLTASRLRVSSGHPPESLHPPDGLQSRCAAPPTWRLSRAANIIPVDGLISFAILAASVCLLFIAPGPAGAAYSTNGSCNVGDHKLATNAKWHYSSTGKSVMWEHVAVTATRYSGFRIEVRTSRDVQWVARGITNGGGWTFTYPINFPGSMRSYVKTTAFFANGTSCAAYSYR